MTDQHNHGHHHHGHAQADADAPSVKDPVCGMTVQLDAGKPSLEHAGESYHFCSRKCHDKFAADPEHFISGAHKKQSLAVPKGAKYTCPMHPEIVRDEPSDCPICGMALVPMGFPQPTTNRIPNLSISLAAFGLAPC